MRRSPSGRAAEARGPSESGKGLGHRKRDGAAVIATARGTGDRRERLHRDAHRPATVEDPTFSCPRHSARPEQ